jgi:hypothetical protein
VPLAETRSAPAACSFKFAATHNAGRSHASQRIVKKVSEFFTLFSHLLQRGGAVMYVFVL